LLLISTLAGKTSFKFGIPTLLLFLLIGMLAGSESIGGIHFDDAQIAQFIGIVLLCFILFSSGSNTDWQAIRPIVWHGVALLYHWRVVHQLAVGAFVAQNTGFNDL